MRDILNLQALKRSRSKKHNTIYNKAHRLMQGEFRTPDLTDEEVLDMAEKFPTLSVKCMVGGDISVRSVRDQWIIRDEGRFYTLYHKGISMYKGRIKDSFHVQDIFSDLNYIFASVVSHDCYVLGTRKYNPHEISELIEA